MLRKLIIVIVMSIGAVHAASFPCSDAHAKKIGGYTDIEKKICTNKQLSKLDEILAENYQMIFYVQEDEDAYRQEQRDWLRNIRNKCGDVSCLIRVYRDRNEALLAPFDDRSRKLFELYETPQVETFTTTNGKGFPWCQDYAKVLNSTPVEDLRACKLPDLSGLPFNKVEFKPISFEKIESLSERLPGWYNRERHYTEDEWADKAFKYEIGYFTAGEAFIDIWGDDELEHVIQTSYPFSQCLLTGRHDIENFDVRLGDALGRDADGDSTLELDLLDPAVVAELSEVVGRVYSYRVVSADRIRSFNGGGINNLFKYESAKFGDRYLFLDQTKIHHASSNNPPSDRDYIRTLSASLSRMDKVTPMAVSGCEFWLND